MSGQVENLGPSRFVQNAKVHTGIKKERLTQERLKELLHYNEDTGIFTWLVCVGRKIRAGDIAGCINNKGYVHIAIDRRLYKAHRLAWLYTEGYLPEGTIDHKNRKRSDNWRLNLREATHQCQSRNCGISKNNTSGVKGLSWSKVQKGWTAAIVVGGKTCRIGCFKDKVEAACHRYAVEQCLGFPECDINSTAKMLIDGVR